MEKHGYSIIDTVRTPPSSYLGNTTLLYYILVERLLEQNPASFVDRNITWVLAGIHQDSCRLFGQENNAIFSPGVFSEGLCEVAEVWTTSYIGL